MITTSNIDNFLPFGETLRSFCEQSFLSKSDLNKLLRARGVFVQNTDKQNTIPKLLTYLLSPSEFDFLVECQNTREDRPKKVTQMIDWNSSASLINAIPPSTIISQFAKDEYSNYRLIGSPNFVPINGDQNKVRLDYEIERSDLSKSWSVSRNKFKGSVDIQTISQGDKIKLALTYTAVETKQVNDKLSKGIVSHFKQKNYIKPKAELKKILLSDFTNESRIEFFWSLIGEINDNNLFFDDNIIDISFMPDDSIPFPKDIDWMENKVNDLKLKGKDLHKTFFINDKKYHKFFIFGRIDAKYRFKFEDMEGKCTISFRFPEYNRKKMSEFEIDIVNLSFDINKRSKPRSTAEHLILNLIEDYKITEYENITKNLNLI